MRRSGQRRADWVRPAGVAVILLLLLGLPATSTAAPTRAEIEAAEAKLRTLNEHLSLLVEKYNQAKLRLEDVRGRLVEVRREAADARTVVERARALLSERAAEAFMGMGSRFDVLLGAGSFTEFSDRLEFLGQIAQGDADLATTAERAGQRAAWLAEQLHTVAGERAAVVEQLRRREAEIRAAIAEQEDLVADLRASFRRARAAAVPVLGSPGSVTPPSGPVPAPSSGARLAIEAAYSALGTPYQWGGASPETGFDCSGLTMWSWAHAGVSLPHSSAAQYASLPYVSRDQVQPGDLLFFYTPIHHVGLYIGGGRMIDAPHTGTVVAIRGVLWDSFIGAARPG